MAACARDPASAREEREAYVALLKSRDLSTAQRMERCLSFDDPLLRTDCALVAAEGAPKTGGGRVEDWCADVPQGRWREECWFMASERARRDGDLLRALDLCRSSGAFVTDCRQHLWQLALHGAVPAEGPPGFVSAVPGAREVLARFLPLVGDDPDFEERFWFRWFQEGFERSKELDVRACAPFPSDTAARCRTACADLYRTRLDRVLFTCAPCREAFCSRGAADPTVPGILGFEMGLAEGEPVSVAVQSPILDEAVRDTMSRHCGEGGSTGRAPRR
jgi:hypothetical protein